MWKKIAILMEEKGWNQKQLAYHSRISPGHLTEIKKGRSGVSAEKLKSIADALEISVDFLLSNDESFPRVQAFSIGVSKETPANLAEEAARKALEEYEMRRVHFEPSPNEIKIPYYGNFASAGTPEEFEEQSPDGYEFISRKDCSNDEKAFAVRISGDSMSPLLFEGDELVISPNTSPQDGNIVVAWVEGEGISVKRLQINGDNRILVPENPKYKAIVLDGRRWKILGRVMSIRRRF